MVLVGENSHYSLLFYLLKLKGEVEYNIFWLYRRQNCWSTSKNMFLFLSIRCWPVRRRRLCWRGIPWKKHRSVMSNNNISKQYDPIVLPIKKISPYCLWLFILKRFAILSCVTELGYSVLFLLVLQIPLESDVLSYMLLLATSNSGERPDCKIFRAEARTSCKDNSSKWDCRSIHHLSICGMTCYYSLRMKGLFVEASVSEKLIPDVLLRRIHGSLTHIWYITIIHVTYTQWRYVSWTKINLMSMSCDQWHHGLWLGLACLEVFLYTLYIRTWESIY